MRECVRVLRGKFGVVAMPDRHGVRAAHFISTKPLVFILVFACVLELTGGESSSDLQHFTVAQLLVRLRPTRRGRAPGEELVRCDRKCRADHRAREGAEDGGSRSLPVVLFGTMLSFLACPSKKSAEIHIAESGVG
ncbi:hypothetical protein EJB05_12779 [Eragrostis curvula]|uniref:Uncharacterized protein n=1 Tax=Eragrostis curvula TaxID=38414 RepID=A0A5J9VUR3_9POAL|nr:hypothetical protein EJB05_12779 [Eragrostis curvula]